MILTFIILKYYRDILLYILLFIIVYDYLILIYSIIIYNCYGIVFINSLNKYYDYLYYFVLDNFALINL